MRIAPCNSPSCFAKLAAVLLGLLSARRAGRTTCCKLPVFCRFWCVGTRSLCPCSAAGGVQRQPAGRVQPGGRQAVAAAADPGVGGASGGAAAAHPVAGVAHACMCDAPLKRTTTPVQRMLSGCDYCIRADVCLHHCQATCTCSVHAPVQQRVSRKQIAFPLKPI